MKMICPFQVSTIFWWDNYDKNTETNAGGGSIHVTPGIAFQEVGEGSIPNYEIRSIPKSNRRSLTLKELEDIGNEHHVNPKTNPSK